MYSVFSRYFIIFSVFVLRSICQIVKTLATFWGLLPSCLKYIMSPTIADDAPRDRSFLCLMTLLFTMTHLRNLESYSKLWKWKLAKRLFTEVSKFYSLNRLPLTVSACPMMPAHQRWRDVHGRIWASALDCHYLPFDFRSRRTRLALATFCESLWPGFISSSGKL